MTKQSYTPAYPADLRQRGVRLHEFRRHPEMPRRLAVSVTFVDKRDNPRSQLYRMWLSHL